MKIGQVHTTIDGFVMIGVSADDDAFLRAFDDAARLEAPVRVVLGYQTVSLSRLRHIAALALGYHAVEARWDLLSVASSYVDLFLVAPGPLLPAAVAGAVPSPDLRPSGEGTTTAEWGQALATAVAADEAAHVRDAGWVR